MLDRSSWPLKSGFICCLSSNGLSSWVLICFLVSTFAIFDRSLATHGTLGSFLNWHSFKCHLWETFLVWLRNLWSLIITHLFQLIAQRFLIFLHVFNFALQFLNLILNWWCIQISYFFGLWGLGPVLSFLAELRMLFINLLDSFFDPIQEAFVVNQDLVLNAWKHFDQWDYISVCKVVWIQHLQDVIKFSSSHVSVVVLIYLFNRYLKGFQLIVFMDNRH